MIRDSNVLRRVVASALAAVVLIPVAGSALDVSITAELESVETIHEGKDITIRRNQDRRNTINPYYAYTSRRCPPFCIQPIVAAPDIETVGELEVLEYLQRIGAGDQSVLVVDTRTPQWPRRGMIPGAVNIPWTVMDPTHAAPQTAKEVLRARFGARLREDGSWDFSNARTLVLYCNGMWCSQSTSAIETLLRVNYPREKLKWYRGGMQAWEILGLTTVKGGH